MMATLRRSSALDVELEDFRRGALELVTRDRHPWRRRRMLLGDGRVCGIDQCRARYGGFEDGAPFDVRIDAFGDEPRNSPEDRPTDHRAAAAPALLRQVHVERHR
jgi:hypothetical protein